MLTPSNKFDNKRLRPLILKGNLISGSWWGKGLDPNIKKIFYLAPGFIQQVNVIHSSSYFKYESFCNLNLNIIA
jgi:hypothetical protein